MHYINYSWKYLYWSGDSRHIRKGGFPFFYALSINVLTVLIKKSVPHCVVCILKKQSEFRFPFDTKHLKSVALCWGSSLITACQVYNTWQNMPVVFWSSGLAKFPPESPALWKWLITSWLLSSHPLQIKTSRFPSFNRLRVWLHRYVYKACLSCLSLIPLHYTRYLCSSKLTALAWTFQAFHDYEISSSLLLFHGYAMMSVLKSVGISTQGILKQTKYIFK